MNINEHPDSMTMQIQFCFILFSLKFSTCGLLLKLDAAIHFNNHHHTEIQMSFYQSPASKQKQKNKLLL